MCLPFSAGIFPLGDARPAPRCLFLGFPRVPQAGFPPQLLLRCRSWRGFASQTDGESRLARVLREKFPRASAIKVVDISGEEKLGLSSNTPAGSGG